MFGDDDLKAQETKTCPECDGNGFFEESVDECCGHGTESGECCGVPVEGLDQVTCFLCQGKGTIQ